MENSNDLIRFCENIRALREGENLSRTAFAKRLHISTRTLAKIEGGTLPPRLDCRILFQICREFGITPDELFR